jgi:uncharacterized membrane protein
VTESKQQTKTETGRSKYLKMLLILIMAVLLFGGPYATYAVTDILHRSYRTATIGSLIMVVAGLVLMWYLIRKKILF